MEEHFHSRLNYKMIPIRSVLYFIVAAVFVLAATNAKEVSVVWSREGEYFANGNKALILNAGDKLAIICPNSDVSNGRMPHNIMFENVWRVGSTGYNLCDASVDGKLLLKCKDPEQIKKVVLDELYAQLGRTYYLISTSNGLLSSLDNKKGGHCETQNLKLTVYVQ